MHELRRFFAQREKHRELDCVGGVCAEEVLRDFGLAVLSEVEIFVIPVFVEFISFWRPRKWASEFL